MLRQLEWGVQNGPATTFLKILFQFKNLLYKSWLDVPTTQISIFILFLSVFSLRVLSLRESLIVINK